MKPFMLVSITAFLVGWFAVTACRADMSPTEILRKADEARGNLEGIIWKLDILSIERGREAKRAMEIKVRDYDFLATLKAPPKVKGQKLLMVDHNMWFGRPGISKPVPISPRQKMIGMASNGDIAATNYADDYDVLSNRDDSVSGEDCYLFELKSKGENTTYDRIRYWVSKKRLVGVQAEFFTVSGKLFKKAQFEYGNQVLIEGMQRPFISRMVIHDALISDNVTNLEFKDPILLDLPDATFNLNLLMM